MEHNLTEPKWESEGAGESHYETHTWVYVVVQAVFQILAHNENILCLMRACAQCTHAHRETFLKMYPSWYLLETKLMFASNK